MYTRVRYLHTHLTGFEEYCIMTRFVSTRREEPPRISYNSVRNVIYGKCLKNHAAHIGGHALDGCQEFMANGPEGTQAASICQACGCNKSYHQREVVALGVYPQPPNGA